jgi:hypothetical protein
MSTNSIITVECTDGKFRQIYVHWDGDSHLDILKNHYNTQENAEILISLGDLSVLAERPSPKMGENHTFDNPIQGICVAYHRDREEPWDDETPEYSPYQKMCLSHGIKPFGLPKKNYGTGFREFKSLKEAKRDLGSNIEYHYILLLNAIWKKEKC